MFSISQIQPSQPSSPMVPIHMSLDVIASMISGMKQNFQERSNKVEKSINENTGAARFKPLKADIATIVRDCNTMLAIIKDLKAVNQHQAQAFKINRNIGLFLTSLAASEQNISERYVHLTAHLPASGKMLFSQQQKQRRSSLIQLRNLVPNEASRAAELAMSPRNLR